MSFLSFSLRRARARSHFSADEAGSSITAKPLCHSFNLSVSLACECELYIDKIYSTAILVTPKLHAGRLPRTSKQSATGSTISALTLSIVSSTTRQYIHTNKHTYTHTHMYTRYRYRNMHTCTYTHMYLYSIRTHTHRHTHTRTTHTHTDTQTHRHTHRDTQTHTVAHTHTDTHTHTHTFAHTHVHIHLGCSKSRKLYDQRACMITGYEPDLEGNVCLSRLGTATADCREYMHSGSDQDSV